jgi:hypothetical protein
LRARAAPVNKDFCLRRKRIGAFVPLDPRNRGGVLDRAALKLPFVVRFPEAPALN